MISRWVAATAGVATACAVLAALVFAHHADLVLGQQVAEERVTSTDPNPRLDDGGAVVDLDGNPSTRHLPPRTVALTFDDGPDPVWTPRIAEVLDRYGVPGTFYVIGQEVLRYPELVRTLHERGHEIGNHTYTHPKLGTLPSWRARWQVELTQRAIVGATGMTAATFRPPYAGTPRYFPDTEIEAAKAATERGLALVLSTHAAPDFDPGVTTEELLAASLPALGAGAVITLHDGGGDRARSVEVLERLIPVLQAHDYRFVKASELAGVSPAAPSITQRVLGRALITGTGTIAALGQILWVLGVAVLGLTILRSTVLVVVASRNHRRRRGLPAPPPGLDPVSVIVPAYNEREVIAATISSILASDHPEVEVLVVDDGSTDGTAEVLDAAEFAGVRIVRKDNGGKASALDTGVRLASHDLVVLMDGDTLLEPTTLGALVAPFAQEDVAAVAGNARVGNRSGMLGALQHVEYTIASAVERRLFDELGVMPCVPGAVGAFRRRVVLELGGVSSDTLAEDTDLTMAVARAGWRTAYAPDARAWTEVPATLRGLYRQRLRWNYGILQSVAKHRRAAVESGTGGRLGRVVLPYLVVLGYAVALVAPAVDLLLLKQLLVGSVDGASLAVWAGVMFSSVALGVYALRLEGDRWRWAAVLPLQQVVYRQLLYLTVFRSLGAAISGIRLPWNKLDRTGLATVGRSSSPTEQHSDPDREEELVIDLRDDAVVRGEATDGNVVTTAEVTAGERA
jgi:cellulose synthase/poly-beta-1,6-N-acetylglucosamine synthase-like glycosyltransferase/peptidoglycan/xylan/chitin deacetylase (PgdA/CDA1 family)